MIVKFYINNCLYFYKKLRLIYIYWKIKRTEAFKCLKFQKVKKMWHMSFYPCGLHLYSNIIYKWRRPRAEAKEDHLDAATSITNVLIDSSWCGCILDIPGRYSRSYMLYELSIDFPIDTHLLGYTDLGDTEDHVHHLFMKMSTHRRVSINPPCLEDLKVIKHFNIKRHGIIKEGHHAVLVFQTYHIHFLNQENLH